MSSSQVSPARTKTHGMLRVPTVQLPSYLRSIGGALVLEVMILAIAAAVLLHKHETVVKEPIMLTIEEPVLNKPKEQPKPPQPKVKPVPQPPRPQLVTPPPPQPVPPEVKPQETLPPDPAFAQHVEPPKPPPPPPPPEVSAEMAANFKARVLAAVEARTQQLYPHSLYTMGVQGRVLMHFVYQDGVISGAEIKTPSAVNALFNSAALAVINTANYPKPPKEMAGKREEYDVWVNFNILSSN